jgi:hypothetical protein
MEELLHSREETTQGSTLLSELREDISPTASCNDKAVMKFGLPVWKIKL